MEQSFQRPHRQPQSKGAFEKELHSFLWSEQWRATRVQTGPCPQRAHLAHLTGDPESLAVFALWVGRPAEADPLWEAGRLLEYGAAPGPPCDHGKPRKARQHPGQQSALSLCGARCCLLPPWEAPTAQSPSWGQCQLGRQRYFLSSGWGHRTRKSGWTRRPRHGLLDPEDGLFGNTEGKSG